MATIKVEIVSGANTWTQTKTVSGPDLTRLIAAVKTQAGLPSDATNAVIADAYINQVYVMTKGLVKNVESAAAASAASAAVEDITLT
jgi:hypothetical protein